MGRLVEKGDRGSRLVGSAGKAVGLIGGGFALWMAFCLFLGLASMAGVGYAIYWGLSIAQQAVDQNAPTQVIEE